MILLLCVEVSLLLRRTGRVLIQSSAFSSKSILAPQLGQYLVIFFAFTQAAQFVQKQYGLLILSRHSHVT